MGEIDKARTLEFERGPYGLHIRIPVTHCTPRWRGQFNQLALEQHANVDVVKDDFLLLRVAPEESPAELMTRLDLVRDLVRRATELEQEQLAAEEAAAAPLEEAALQWWRSS